MQRSKNTSATKDCAFRVFANVLQFLTVTYWKLAILDNTIWLMKEDGWRTPISKNKKASMYARRPAEERAIGSFQRQHPGGVGEVPRRGSAVGSRRWTSRGRPGPMEWGEHSCLKDLGDPVASWGHDLFISESGCSYLPTSWGVKVSGGVRRALSQLLAQRGAVWGTAPPCGGGLPVPGVQASRARPPHRLGLSQPSGDGAPTSAEGCHVYAAGKMSTRHTALKFR